MKIIIRLDRTGNHNHKIEQVKKFPEEDNILCCSSKDDALGYISMIERMSVSEIQKKYAALKKIVADFS